MPYHNDITVKRWAEKWIKQEGKKKIEIWGNKDGHFPTMILQILEVLSSHFLRKYFLPMFKFEDLRSTVEFKKRAFFVLVKSCYYLGSYFDDHRWGWSVGFLFCFLWPYLWHMEVLRPGVELELQLSEARDWTHILMDS